MKPIVHGVGLSPFVRKVCVVLREKGIDYELRPIIPLAKTPELLALNPLGKIPIYQEGDFILPDSSAIIAYLERAHPAPPVYPSAAKELGRALFLEEVGDTREVEIAGKVFFERFVKPNVLQQKTDESIVRQAVDVDLPPLLDWLETQVSGSVGVVAGSFSVADIALASPFFNMHLGGENVDGTRWPKFARFLEAVAARPSVASVLADERRAFAATT